MRSLLALELERQTGTLANFTNFTIGNARNAFAGFSVAQTFGGDR